MEERNGAPRDRILQTGGRDPDALVGQAGEMALHAVVPPTIGTKGFFLMMELPSELRLEVRAAPFYLSSDYGPGARPP
jgi:hypothetical protein